MAWVRIDDGFDEHPKIAGLDERAVAVFVFGLCYCNRNLTDGFIPASYGRRVSSKGVKALEVAGLWEPVEGGWQVHDYADYQNTKEEITLLRQRNAQRQSRHRNAVTDSVTNAVSNGLVTPAPNPNPNQTQKTSSSTVVSSVPAAVLERLSRPPIGLTDDDEKKILTKETLRL